MAKPQDILLDEDFDLRIEDGDFVVGDCEAQNCTLLLLLNKGEIKQKPLATVGAIQYKDDNGPSALLQEIQQRFAEDGMQMNRVWTENGKIKTDGYYK